MASDRISVKAADSQNLNADAGILVINKSCKFELDEKINPENFFVTQIRDQTINACKYQSNSSGLLFTMKKSKKFQNQWIILASKPGCPNSKQCGFLTKSRMDLRGTIDAKSGKVEIDGASRLQIDNEIKNQYIGIIQNDENIYANSKPHFIYDIWVIPAPIHHEMNLNSPEIYIQNLNRTLIATDLDWKRFPYMSNKRCPEIRCQYFEKNRTRIIHLNLTLEIPHEFNNDHQIFTLSIDSTMEENILHTAKSGLNYGIFKSKDLSGKKYFIIFCDIFNYKFNAINLDECKNVPALTIQPRSYSRVYECVLVIALIMIFGVYWIKRPCRTHQQDYEQIRLVRSPETDTLI